MRTLCTFLLLTFLGPLTLGAAITVEARFDPPRIPFGDRSQYVIEIRETSDRRNTRPESLNRIPIPAPDRLRLDNGRTSTRQQTRMINGIVEYSVTQSVVFDVVPTGEGTFTIPSYEIEYKGGKRTVPAVSIEVLPRSAAAGPTFDELVQIDADLPETLYVGQSLSFSLKLYLSNRISLRGLHNFERRADGFTISELPDQTNESIEYRNGHPYRVLSWPMTLTPIRTGNQSIEFEFELSARLPESRQRRGDPFGGSPFGGSLFDDIFGQIKQLTVAMEPRNLTILPLPDADRPDSFTGGIGEFTIQVGADAEQCRVGEPIMLTVELTGTGNFGRINPPVFPESPNWRIYDPEIEFEPLDALGLTGRKRFDYALIPQTTGSLEIPALEFSYFDPESKTYRTLDAPAIPLDVSPGRNVSILPPQPSTPSAETKSNKLDPVRTPTTDETLRTLDYQLRPPRQTQLTALHDPVFITVNLLATGGILASAYLLRRRDNRARDPLYTLRARSKSAARTSAIAAQSAARANDPETFYREAQSAIRHFLTAKTGQNLLTAGTETLVAAWAANGATPDQLETLRELLTSADVQRFGSNRALLQSEMPDRLNQILNSR